MKSPLLEICWGDNMYRPAEQARSGFAPSGHPLAALRVLSAVTDFGSETAVAKLPARRALHVRLSLALHPEPLQPEVSMKPLQVALALASLGFAMVACDRATPTDISTPSVRSGAAVSDAAAVAVSIKDLGTLPNGTNSYAAAINDNGQVAGDSDAKGGRHAAFIWQAGKFTILPFVPGSTLAVVNGMNSLGSVVGYSILGVGIDHATLWQNGTALDLGTLGGPSSFAESMNTAGQVAGFSDIANGYQRRAFVWQNGVMKQLPSLSPNSDDDLAFAINGSGVVVGQSDNAANQDRAVRWQNGVVTDLGTLGGTTSVADGINDAGVIVGLSATANGQTHAFRWENGVMTDLGLLPGGVSSFANAINNAGQIVGYATTSSGPDHGFFWQNGVMTDLGTLGGAFSTGRSINSQARIAGFSLNSSVIDHAVVWTVTP